MKKYREVEFKYRADSIDLSDFVAFCLERRPARTVTASGFDRFYESKSDPNCFCRHRQEPDKFNQLSFKRKTTDKNNYIRTEHNLDLGLKVNEDQVEALCAEFGYRYNTSIFKNCFIHKYEDYTLVYYICYNEDLNELGRFIEIEVDEDYPWKSEAEAWGVLTLLEEELKPLGISAQARIKRSLFEMFRCEK